jgi:transmembrane sensor
LPAQNVFCENDWPIWFASVQTPKWGFGRPACLITEPMKNAIDLDLLDRYLAGECTPEEKARVTALAATDADLRRLLAELPKAVRSPDEPQWNVDQAFSRVTAARATQSRRAVPWRRIAAAIVITLGVAVVWQSRRTPDSAGPEIAAQSYSAPLGSPHEVTLSDGSKVTLAPGSRLNVPATFPARGRDVYLTGEAFFEVAHDAARPYVVHAAHAQTRVLGTSFNVSAYADIPEVSVVVVTGRVQLSGAAQPGRELTPGQLGTLEPSGAVTVEPVDVEAYTNWLRGLSFNSVRFADALPRLERWFGVRLIIADRELGEKRLTAFFAQQSLSDVLDALATTLNARYERSADRITFHAQK